MHTLSTLSSLLLLMQPCGAIGRLVAFAELAWRLFGYELEERVCRLHDKSESNRERD